MVGRLFAERPGRVAPRENKPSVDQLTDHAQVCVGHEAVQKVDGRVLALDQNPCHLEVGGRQRGLDEVVGAHVERDRLEVAEKCAQAAPLSAYKTPQGGARHGHGQAKVPDEGDDRLVARRDRLLQIGLVLAGRDPGVDNGQYADRPARNRLGNVIQARAVGVTLDQPVAHLDAVVSHHVRPPVGRDGEAHRRQPLDRVYVVTLGGRVGHVVAQGELRANDTGERVPHEIADAYGFSARRPDALVRKVDAYPGQVNNLATQRTLVSPGRGRGADLVPARAAHAVAARKQPRRELDGETHHTRDGVEAKFHLSFCLFKFRTLSRTKRLRHSHRLSTPRTLSRSA